MRSLKSGLVTFSIAGLCAVAVFVGCSADGGSGGIGDETTTEQDPTEGTAMLPPSSQDEDEAPAGNKPAPPAKKDAGKTDSGYDAGPPPPVPGTACSTLNEIKKKSCGACGEQSTVCLATGDSGAGTWSDYSPCENELAGGCVPGTVVDEPCGNCGTVKKTCTQYCAWTSGACSGQPQNSCKPGTIEYSTAGCSTPSTYRNRTCGAACTWGGFSATCDEPNNPNKMTISGTVGQVVTAQWTLASTSTTKRPYGCSGGTPSSASNYPFVAVEVKNPTNQTAEISMYHSAVGGGTQLDTLIWVYKKTLPPSDDASLAACDFGVADSCLSANPCGNTGGNFDWAGIEKVTIPPQGKILVYSAGYTSTELGNFNLNLRTDKLQ